VTASVSLASSSVNETSQGLKDAGDTMNLVQDDEPILVLVEVQLRVRELGTV
jgi:hypothetical protein